jgi:hypothetical protein
MNAYYQHKSTPIAFGDCDQGTILDDQDGDSHLVFAQGGAEHLISDIAGRRGWEVTPEEVQPV